MWLLVAGLIFVAAITIGIIFNLRFWPSLVAIHRSDQDESSSPFVSVLIPARNESRNLRRCLSSIQAQTYKQLEIICLDDRSEDDTAEIIEQFAATDPRVKLMRGANLPEGWVGKSHACAQLAGASSGDWLLFTDADTVHAPDSIQRAVATAMKRRADLLTGFPRILSNHALGNLVLPLMHFLIALHLPIFQVERSRKSMFMAAHGAFMLYRREAYEQIGGHGATKHRNALVEDMTMAKATKEAGYRVSLVDITPIVACEMYEQPAQVWNGFAKNIYNGIGRSTPLLFTLFLLYFSLYVFPIFIFLAFLSQGQLGYATLAFGIVVFGMLHKALVDRKFQVNGLWFLGISVSVCLLIAIGIRSWFLGVTSRGYEWKGRIYR